MAKTKAFPPELRERAVRLLLEHEKEYPSRWAAIKSIAEKVGCSAEALRSWLNQAVKAGAEASGLTAGERERLSQLERENRELRRANEILRKASAYFAQAELDRRAT
jgi:transposase